MNKLMSKYVPKDIAYRLRRPNPFGKSDTGIWNRRPLPPTALEFAGCTLATIEAMYRGMRNGYALPRFLFNRIEEHSRRALEDFRRRDLCVSSQTDKRTWLEEISILDEYRTENEGTNLVTWMQAELLRVQDDERR